MFGLALMILTMRAAAAREALEAPPIEPLTCRCIYNVGCGSFHPQVRGCECPSGESN